MGQKLSKPELRAQKIFKILNINLQKNDGNENSVKIYLREDKKGTSLIRNNHLFTDYPKYLDKDHSPKNYTSITPDYFYSLNFIEIKDNISGMNWEKLSIHSLNDNIRLTLLRMKCGIIKNIGHSYYELNRNEKEIVNRDLNKHPRSKPQDRYYLRWIELISLIKSPNENLKNMKININGYSLPIKIVTGLENVNSLKLYIIDNQIMNQWENLI